MKHVSFFNLGRRLHHHSILRDLTSRYECIDIRVVATEKIDQAIVNFPFADFLSFEAEIGMCLP